MNRSRLVIPLVVPLLWIAAPGQASPAKACPDGAACVWDETNFQGNRATIKPQGCIDSRIRSAVNATDTVLRFFFSGGCVGAEAGSLQPGEEFNRISASSATGDCSKPVDSCNGESPEAPAP